MQEHPPEHELLGGNVSLEVVRVGDTVRRPTTPWSSSVDALLGHLHRVGFEGAPRPLGYDEAGRQMISFAEGHVGPDPSDLDDARLKEVGRLIRRLHDAASSFVAPRDAVWNVAIAPDREELICHHDLAPWNLVRTATNLVFIDWDGAGPGSRLWDLAYAAHGFIPLSSGASLSDESAATRLAALIDGYDLDEADRATLAALLARRVWSMYELLRHGHEHGDQPWGRLWDEGHGEVWRADAQYVESREGLWAATLQRRTDSRT
jgi:Ser/Thr protein kinase RdoA (MazF antagonist)